MTQAPDSREIVIHQQASLAVERDPDTVLMEASHAAKALKGVLDQKTNKVVMGGEQYLEFEDWITLGRFYGVTAREDGDAEYVEFGTVHGFKASAVALDKDGGEISRATAFCLSDEEKWGSRPKYVYGYVCIDGSWSEDDPGRDQIIWEPNPTTGKNRPKKERRHVGDEQVPLFQLASMAQTRACAKALRNVLSWVAVLAGYRPTPAEELDGMTVRTANPPDSVEEGRFTEAPTPPKPPTQAQRREARAAVMADDEETARDAHTPAAPVIDRSDPLWKRYLAIRDEARTLLPDELLATLPINVEPPVAASTVKAAGLAIKVALDAAKEVGVGTEHG